MDEFAEIDRMARQLEAMGRVERDQPIRVLYGAAIGAMHDLLIALNKRRTEPIPKAPEVPRSVRARAPKRR